MLNKKKEKLFIADLIADPAVAYPAYYTVSISMAKNEMLHSVLIAVHSFDFEHYDIPKDHEAIFTSLHSGTFPIYKEKYAIGYFGGRMMYLESHGWKSLPATEDLFKLENWLVG
jgi:hypothetical protein